MSLQEETNEIEGFRDRPLSEEEVGGLIEQMRNDVRYFQPLQVDVRNLGDDWERVIHAARVLSDVFSQLSETRMAYDKVKHSMRLTNWLIEHNPATLKEISDLILRVIDAQ